MSPEVALRLAFFSPVPPAASGVADYVADLLPLLPPEWEVELFVDQEGAPGELGGAPVRQHAQWREIHARRPFDLCVYHVGNNVAHEYALPYVREQPGLLVLHDAVLHPSRLASHLAHGDLAGYREVARAASRSGGDALAHLVASGLGGAPLYWRFPLSEDLVRGSLLTVVHGEVLAHWLRAVSECERVATVGHWRAVPQVAGPRLEDWARRLHGPGPLIGTFGHIGPAHGLEEAISALVDLAPEHEFRLAVAGQVDPSVELLARAAAEPIAGRVHWLGRLDDDDFGAVMRTVDLAINLRYPTARASSGTLQQLLQLGVPCVVHDLVHLRDLPSAAVVRVPPGPAAEAAQQLRSGLAHWLGDRAARERAGADARAWADLEITPENMARSYRDAVARALRQVPAA